MSNNIKNDLINWSAEQLSDDSPVYNSKDLINALNSIMPSLGSVILTTNNHVLSKQEDWDSITMNTLNMFTTLANSGLPASDFPNNSGILLVLGYPSYNIYIAISDKAVYYRLGGADWNKLLTSSTVKDLTGSVATLTNNLSKLSNQQTTLSNLFNTFKDGTNKQLDTLNNQSTSQAKMLEDINNQLVKLKETQGSVNNTSLTVAPAFVNLQTQVKNSAVGTNLLTNLPSNWTQGWISPVSVGNPPAFNSYNARIRTRQTISVSSNSPYTISISGDSFKFSWLELGSNGNVTYITPWITSANYTFTTTSTTTQLYIVVAYKTDDVIDTSSLPKIKLERGIIATDWCPNPTEILMKSKASDDAREVLGDFQDGNVLTGFFNDETIEVGGEIPSYYLTRLNQFTTISADNFNVGFITDNHHQLSSFSPNSLAHYAYIAAASRRAPLQAIIAGGDNTNGWYDKTQKLIETRQATSTLFNRVKAGTDVFFAMGNHDNGIGQSGNNTPVTTLSDAELKAFYQTHSLVYGETRDNGSLYGYKDYQDKKVRLIWLNSFDLPYTLNEDGTFKYNFLMQSAYQNQQLNWLATMALKLPDNTWQTMIFTHCPLPGTFEVAAGQAKLSQFNSDVLIGVLNAFQNGTTFKIDDTTRDFPVSLNCDFTAQGKGTIIGLISGHIHADGHMIYEGINCIETAASLCYQGDTYRIKNTESEDCWDIFSVDTTARKIHAYRFGLGADRDFTY